MTTESLNDPIDLTHEEAMLFQGEIRDLFQEAKDRVAVWEPRPMPASYGRA